MSLNVTIGLNAETLAALNALTAAVIGVSNVAPAAAQAATVVEPEAKDTAKADAKPAAKPAAKAAAKTTTKAAVKEEAEEEEAEEVEPVTIYWFSSATDEVGIVESEEEYKALKKADAKTVKITEAKHKAHLAKQELEAQAEAAGQDLDEEDEVPTEQDVIDVFGTYLPTTLTDQEKAERRPFVKAILDRFGAKRATALKEGDRRLAINLVERKMAGDDVDPAEDEFEAIDGLV